MATRNDVRFIMIPLSLFQSFDHGAEIEIEIPAQHDLRVGDIFSWECAQYDGEAKVIEKNGTSYKIKKIH